MSPVLFDAQGNKLVTKILDHNEDSQQILGKNLLMFFCQKYVAGETYEVAATIRHLGNTSKSGHYVTLCRTSEDGLWRECNDAENRKRRFPGGLRNCYVIVYEKVNQT